MSSIEARQAASDLYGRMYRIRQSCFQPTHIGLGIWGKHLPLSDHAKEQISQINRERNKMLRLAKKLQAQGL